MSLTITTTRFAESILSLVLQSSSEQYSHLFERLKEIVFNFSEKNDPLSTEERQELGSLSISPERREQLLDRHLSTHILEWAQNILQHTDASSFFKDLNPESIDSAVTELVKLDHIIRKRFGMLDATPFYFNHPDYQAAGARHAFTKEIMNWMQYTILEICLSQEYLANEEAHKILKEQAKRYQENLRQQDQKLEVIVGGNQAAQAQAQAALARLKIEMQQMQQEETSRQQKLFAQCQQMAENSHRRADQLAHEVTQAHFATNAALQREQAQAQEWSREKQQCKQMCTSLEERAAASEREVERLRSISPEVTICTIL